VVLEPLHADPADRTIAATSLAHDATLVTKVERLRGVDGLACLWCGPLDGSDRRLRIA
jgi:PIN domain nuclease of toxin-antitoxin system